MESVIPAYKFAGRVELQLCATRELHLIAAAVALDFGNVVVEVALLHRLQHGGGNQPLGHGVRSATHMGPAAAVREVDLGTTCQAYLVTHVVPLTVVEG